MICKLCGEVVDMEDGCYYINDDCVCLNCLYGMSGAELCRQLGFPGEGLWLE